MNTREEGATLYRMAKAECHHGAGGEESRRAMRRLRNWILTHLDEGPCFEDIELFYRHSRMREEVDRTNELLTWARYRRERRSS